MKKPPLKSLLKSKEKELRHANPKSRDRIRQRLNVLKMVRQLKRESRAA